jgi:lycopene beta-cyclase
MLDVLVIGAGPAGVYLAARLGQAGLSVGGLSPTEVIAPWGNTYSIWVDELEALELTHYLKHRWQDCVVYVNDRPLSLQREYGLLDNQRIQADWLAQAERHHVQWHHGKATQVTPQGHASIVTTDTGQTLTARLVIDASGHHSPFMQRPSAPAVAYQAAYGIVGRFSQPPVAPQRMVLMDYRDDHLSPVERQEPPTFLYAMDLGDGVYFVEETSLAHAPAIALNVLEKRLYKRLAHRQVDVTEIQHVERCLFPMNMPLPNLQQPILGFGGAASMVHPATGYMMGSILRRGPQVVDAIAQHIRHSEKSSIELARAGWDALWPHERVRKYYLYRFGLENLLAWDGPRLRHFFQTFFSLSQADWSGFLADTLSLPALVGAMLVLFRKAPNDVRWGLMQSVFSHSDLLAQTFLARHIEAKTAD